MYSDYAYYQNSFGGNTLPEEFFSFYENRAALLIDRRIGTHLENPPNTIQNACCAIAELLYQAKELSELHEGSVASESTGGWSISYETGSNKTLDMRIEEEMELYLSGTGLLSLAIPYHSARYIDGKWRKY